MRFAINKYIYVYVYIMYFYLGMQNYYIIDRLIIINTSTICLSQNPWKYFWLMNKTNYSRQIQFMYETRINNILKKKQEIINMKFDLTK